MQNLMTMYKDSTKEPDRWCSTGALSLTSVATSMGVCTPSVFNAASLADISMSPCVSFLAISCDVSQKSRSTASEPHYAFPKTHCSKWRATIRMVTYLYWPRSGVKRGVCTDTQCSENCNHRRRACRILNSSHRKPLHKWWRSDRSIT